ncbi:helix-turn-helix transcriptional regulator [Salibacterium aidingense]|uniref:helix-turn-helix transcriptional regulator n=1 Tax=Salibacterium aidingense TaxID=384933 RepID=UPI000408C6A5|nr:YafY family protein [Salibacterium aidingense]
MAKWDNMLAILWILRSREQVTASELAFSLEISVRTVYRYIDALCASGVPIIAESGHEGGYSLAKNFRETPLFFDSDELKAIAHAAMLAGGTGYPFGAELQEAMKKIERQLNDEQYQLLHRHTQGFGVLPVKEAMPEKEVLQKLEKAVAEDRIVHIKYVKKEEETAQTRDMNPYGLAYRYSLWYIAGYCHLRQEMRVFRVDRICHVSIGNTTFSRPAHFSIESYLHDKFQEPYMSKSPKVPVVIEGEKGALDRLARNYYMRSCLTEHRRDQLHLLVNEQEALFYMPNLLLAEGKKVRILEPSRLKEEMTTLLKEMVSHYEEK